MNVNRLPNYLDHMRQAIVDAQSFTDGMAQEDFIQDNPTLYTPADWAKRIEQDSAFVTRVWQQPKIWLIGAGEQLHAPST